MSNITPELERFSVPVTDLQTHPKNVRRGNLDRIAESLEAFGQVKPIVATAEGVIVAGNHTYLAATENLGWDKIAVVAVPLSEEEALRYLLADNRASDDSTYDEAALAEILEELMDLGALAGTGYTPDDVDDVIASAGAIAESSDADFGGGYAESPEETQARLAGRNGGDGVTGGHNRMRDVVLLYDLDRYAQIETAILSLKRQWGIDATRDVVFECVMRTLDLESQTEPPEAAATPAEPQVLA